MNDEMFPRDLTDVIKKIYTRLDKLEKGSIGSVYLSGTLTAYGADGVKTVIGDLTQIGEERVGIAQFVGDTTPPPIPSTPIVTVSAGLMAVTWDGMNQNDEPMAPDFDHFNVYGSSNGVTTLVGSIKNESEVAIYAGAEGGSVWRFYLTAVDVNRNESGPSILSNEVIAMNAGADPLVYDAIDQLKARMAESENLAYQANQKATNAQNIADKALEAAMSGVASPVVISSTEPVDPVHGLIWVDTSADPYVVFRWDGISGAWDVADSGIADLALLAAEAQKQADQASADAELAMTKANQAATSANGKNSVFYVPALPGGSNFVAGDTVFIRPNVGSPITAQYQWDGAEWKSVTLNHQVLASIDLGKATVGELDGQYIKAGSITAKSLVIQNTDNLVSDPKFKYGTSTWKLDGWSIETDSVKRSGTGNFISPVPQTNVEVSPGEWYGLSVETALLGTGSASFRIALDWYTSSGGIIYSDFTDNIVTANSVRENSTLKLQPKKAPLNAYYVVPRIEVAGNSSYTVYLRNIIVSKAMDGNLIVDGSITASKVAANAIEADKIAAGAVTADKVAAKSINAEKLYIGNMSNLVKDEYFAARGAWANPVGGPGTGWSSVNVYPNAAFSQKLTQYQAAQTNMAIYAALMSPDQFIPVVPGEQYKVTSMVLVDGPIGNLNSVTQRAYFYSTNQTGALGPNINTGDITATAWSKTNEWVEVGGIVTVPAGQFFMVPRLTVYYKNNEAPTQPNTSWYVGKTTVTRATDPSLIVDGSIVAQKLTLGSTDNVISDPWFNRPTTEWFSSPGSSITFPSVGGYDGKGSMLVGNNANQHGSYSAKVPTTGASSYKFSAWAKPSIAAPASSISLYARTYKGDGSFTVTRIADSGTVNANAWVFLEGNISWTARSIVAVDFGLYTQNNLASGTTTFSMPNATRMAGGELIVDGAIDGKIIKGATVWSGPDWDTAGTTGGYKISNYGFELADKTGRRTFLARTSDGKVEVTGNIIGSTITGSTIRYDGEGSSEGYDILLTRDANGAFMGFSTPNSLTAGTIRAVNGDGSRPELALRSPSEPGEESRAYIKLQTGITGTTSKVAIGGDVTLEGDWLFCANYSPPGTGALNLGAGNPVFSMGIYNRPYTGASNMYITNNGYIGLTTSKKDNKLVIEDLSPDVYDSLLKIEPKSWFDKTSTEEFAEKMHREEVNKSLLDESGNLEVDSPNSVRRVSGAIAEDVESIGNLDVILQYDTDPNGYEVVNGIQYERIGILLIPIVRELKSKVSELENTVDKQQKLIDQLLSRVEALESM